jgi:hypothetical protein
MRHWQTGPHGSGGSLRLSGRGPAGAGPGPALQGAAQAEAGFVESARSFPDRAPGSERTIVADIEWRSTDLGPV